MTALSGMSSHVTSEVRKSWSASCFFPKCSWQYFNVKKNLFSGILTSDLFEMLVELFGMPPFLWFSFQFPFFIVHFHGSITRPIILSLFICSFLLPSRTEEKKNIGDSHLVYGRLSTLLIRMLFSKSTCQWHTIKTAFLIRIFMQWRYFSLMETNGNIQMWTDFLSKGAEVCLRSELQAHCFSFKDFLSLTWRTEYAPGYYGKAIKI